MRTIQRYIYFVILLLLLSGCFQNAYNPNYMTPSNPLNYWDPCEHPRPIPSYHLLTSCEAYTEKETAEGLELGLYEMIHLALTNSNQLKSSWASSRSAAAQYGQSLSPFFPEINAEYYFEAIREGSFFGTNMVFIDQFSEWGPFLSMSWLIFDTGTTSAKSESMKQALLKANWTHNREIQNVLKTVTIDYYTYIAAKEQVKANEANLEDAETILDATVKKHELGIADYSEELQADAQVAKQELALINSEQTMVDDKTTLIASLGLPANTPLSFKDPVKRLSLDLELPPLDCYVSEAYTYRPDLYAAFSNVLSKAADVEAAQRNQWFKLNLNSSYGRTRFHDGDTDGYNYEVALNLTMPLFKGFDYLNQIREAKAELTKAQALMRELEIDIIKSVTTYYQNFVIATEKVKVNLYYVDVSEAAFRSTLTKFKAGTVDYVTVINSLTDVADARNSLAQSKKDWYTSLTDLAYSTGTLIH